MNNAQVSKSNIACRYYIHGVCKYSAEKCEYSHDRTAQEDMICKFYLAGHCSYGNRCRYDHVKRNKKSNPKTTNASTSSEFVQLSKSGSKAKPIKEDTELNNDSWHNANVFIPGEKWVTNKPAPLCYSQAAGGIDPALLREQLNLTEEELASTLCPYAIQSGQCPFPEGECTYEHGDNCEYCLSACLSKTDEGQRKAHITACIKKHEEEMEEAFKMSENIDKKCTICLEGVEDKELEKDRRFGILSKCNHPFCLECIRKWRQTDINTKRCCPMCRVVSDFVVPSKYWISDEKEKDKLIKNYKEMLNKRPCKYFKEGTGECPFNEHCFYKHALPDGTLASPRVKRFRRNHMQYDYAFAAQIYDDIEMSDFFLDIDQSEYEEFHVDTYVTRIMNGLFIESLSIID